MRLSSQAIRVLEKLKQSGEKSVTEFEEEGFDQATVNRALLELEEENLVKTEEQEEIIQEITEKGEKVLENGSPEHNILEQLDSGITPISDLTGNTNIGVGKAKQKGWIEIDNGKVSKTDKGENIDIDPVKEKLENENFDDELGERGLISSEPQKTKTLYLTEEGEKIDIEEIEEDFNVEAQAETPTTGKKHYYKEILRFARQTWLEMGFEEMEGNYVVPSLLNFDALYTPQDHPARELHDTFFVENPETADLSEYGDKVNHIKETHENGWETGSTGYGGDWSHEEAEKNVIRTHTTAISARRLHDIDINEEELPKKFFIVGRNFRNETVDRTHLAEFYQTDGIVVGKDLNFKNLKGYISKFFEKMGYDKFRLIPSYYPYTEMSVEVQVWDEEAEEWLGMGGAGMFRPEVAKPMLGFEAKVLAWGLGIPRIAFMAAGLEDIRELYRNDIEIINETPVWRPDWKR
ncbi:phenylalanine--tRNA ligase subunit alpha [Candidatus Nanohalobium constans]|uniref:phenylalanine--tRNA ligase n=1 Tax=Candidatus Nanohalobium constans TaxID=2565781 RepID=A0A5Q0UGI2_9ARCH|nr:phenylalanine--tRNA ligase subunit alpha [Candidatus Nanohalobium constans]QGA80099.1 phenylalanyl-tRNA synthetase alpha chain [Candidatus Nanohalobium constans]